MATASPDWVILGSVAQLSATSRALSIPLAAPPRVVLMTAPHDMFPVTTTYVSVLAAGPSGLLLHADQGHTVTGRCQSSRSVSARYYLYLLDTEDLFAVALPNPEFILQPGHLGLIASPRNGDSPGDGADLMVALLQQPVVDGDKATLLICFADEVWDRKRVDYPLPLSPPLAPDGVVSHLGRLWWVDLSRCLLTCDPFADAPVLVVVELPPGKALEYRENRAGELHKWRCVAASGGKLRFVDMYRNRNRDIRRTKRISVWTLADLDSKEWTLDHEVTFVEIWDDDSYKATGLPRKIPVLALIHPLNPNIVYFFLEDYLFGVDLLARKVVECDNCDQLVEPPSEHVATHLVRAWQLPSELSSL